MLEASLNVIGRTGNVRLDALPATAVVAAIELERAEACPSEAELQLVERR